MPRTPIHPGEILADELAELKMSAAKLAKAVHVPPNRISQIIAGKRAVSADTAIRLGKWFATSPEFWLNLQKAYELDMACLKAGPDIKRIIPRKALSGSAVAVS